MAQLANRRLAMTLFSGDTCPYCHRVRIVGYEMVRPGKLSPAEYDNAVRDLVNFMVYMGEPAKLSRYSIGVWVLLFLALLFVVSYAMKKEFWKDVH